MSRDPPNKNKTDNSNETQTTNIRKNHDQGREGVREDGRMRLLSPSAAPT